MYEVGIERIYFVMANVSTFVIMKTVVQDLYTIMASNLFTESTLCFILYPSTHKTKQEGIILQLNPSDMNYSSKSETP